MLDSKVYKSRSVQSCRSCGRQMPKGTRVEATLDGYGFRTYRHHPKCPPLPKSDPKTEPDWAEAMTNYERAMRDDHGKGEL